MNTPQEYMKEFIQQLGGWANMKAAFLTRDDIAPLPAEEQKRRWKNHQRMLRPIIKRLEEDTRPRK